MADEILKCRRHDFTRAISSRVAYSIWPLVVPVMVISSFLNIRYDGHYRPLSANEESERDAGILS